MRKFSQELLVLLVLFSLSFTSCVTSKKFKAMESAKLSLDTALATAQSTISDLETEKNVLLGDKSSLESKVMQIKSDLESVKGEVATFKTQMETAQQTITAKEKALSDKESQLSNIRGQISTAFTSINATGLSITQEGDMFYVSMPEKLLFNSGSASVSRSGRAALQNLSGVLSQNPTMKVLVEGHTDSRRMNAGAAFSSNWDLSVARALTVVKQLVKNGMAPANLIAAGRGEYVPAVTEVRGSPETYKQNRRVEIALIPSLSNLYNLR